MLAILLLIEILVILISGLPIIYIKDQILRKKIILWLIFISLIFNTFSLIVALFMNIQINEFYLIINSNVLFIVESILISGIIYAISNRNNDEEKSFNNQIYDGINQLILAGIIGFVSSSNLLMLISWFVFILILLGVNLFYGETPIDFKNMIPYFLTCGISLVVLYLFAIIIFLDIGTINTVEIVSIGISDELNFIYTILVIIGFGLPCGFFPIGIYHLKKLFQDGSYFSLLFYLMINYSILFNLFRSFQFFELLPLALGSWVSVISILGLILFSYIILKQLFYSLEEKTFSLKKIVSYSIGGDFNNFLMLFSISLLVPDNIKGIYLNGVFLVFSLFILVKLLIFINLSPMILAQEDDQMVTEKGIRYPRFLRYLLYFAGAKFAFPLSFYTSWVLIVVLNSFEVQSNSGFIFLISLIIILHLLYNMISLLTISTINLEIHNYEILFVNKNELESCNISFESKIVIIFIYTLCILINILFFLNLFTYVLL